MSAIASLALTSSTVLKAEAAAFTAALSAVQVAEISAIMRDHRLRRLPRPCRLWRKTITTLTDEIGIHQSFSGKTRNRFQETPFVVVFAFVESKRLFIQVSKKMKRFDRNV